MSDHPSTRIKTGSEAIWALEELKPSHPERNRSQDCPVLNPTSSRLTTLGQRVFNRGHQSFLQDSPSPLSRRPVHAVEAPNGTHSSSLPFVQMTIINIALYDLLELYR
jgi:hypothetical protein